MTKIEIAKELIENDCVKFAPKNPFSYASGLKEQIYCDNRLILSHVEFRNKIISSFIEMITKNKLHFDLVGGIATAGIPHAAIIAERLNSPMVYVRPRPKEHGKKNQVEGDFKNDQCVLLIEDLINQAASLSSAVSGVRAAGLVVSNCLSVVDYQMAEAQKRLKEWSVELFSLTDFDHLVQAAVELKFIDEDGKKLLIEWHNDPLRWSQRS